MPTADLTETGTAPLTRKCWPCGGSGRVRCHQLCFVCTYGEPQARHPEGRIDCLDCSGTGSVRVWCGLCDSHAQHDTARGPRCDRCALYERSCISVPAYVPPEAADLVTTQELPVIDTREAAANLARGVRT